jgi:hypothetical protein
LKQQQKATKDPVQLKRIDQQIQSIDKSSDELESYLKTSENKEVQASKIEEIEVSDNQKLEDLTKKTAYITFIQNHNELTKLENETNDLLARNLALKKELNQELTNDSDTKLTVKQKELIAEIVKNQEVIQKNNNLKAQKSAELASSPNSSEFEWMVKNNIKPTKATPIITTEPPTFETIPTFAIVKKEAVNNAVPLPVNIKNPKGLVYRVQVGAFRKPVPPEFFREFSPVSGDVLANGLTCYMAGYFNNVTAVGDAKNQIRAIGYTDAFVVAYCDGERISFAKARELEQSGQCVPLSDNELRIALEENKILSTETSNPEVAQVQEVPKPIDLSYNQAPGAVEATAVESLQSLFFTVQVGVVNRPMKPEQLPGLTNLFTSRNEKGLLRYSTGKFNSLDLAKEMRKEAVAKGVADAFVVAYYKGKRITIAQANQLIASNGQSIFEESPTNVTNANSSSNVPVTYVPEEIEIVELKTPKEVILRYEMNADPSKVRAELTTLNQFGIFTYNATTNKIISNPINEKELNSTFMQHVSEMNVADFKAGKEKALKFELPANSWNGAFADWILHCPYELKVLQSNEIVFYPRTKQETEELRKIANELLISIHELQY